MNTDLHPSSGDAEKWIDVHYHGKRNFMTPEVISFGWIRIDPYPMLAYELSRGEGMRPKDGGLGPTIWGVTVIGVSWGGTTFAMNELSHGGFHSRTEAWDHILGLMDRAAKGEI